ncbi:hypothetical protein GCM10027046_26110 [Uliginosibacterium flavum]|uniref:TspB protein n=1 Tax=Uliginosibacterium flavum TaxID=1396831 RepID=A0ABV2TK26_9RHOO
MITRILSAVFAIVISLQVGTAQAQALTVSSGVNRAVSGVTQQSMRSRGFAANDPRYYGTLSAMSNVAGTAVGAAAGAGVVTLIGVTAPAWATVMLAAATTAAVGYGVTLALDGLINWLFHSDTLKVDQSSAANLSYSVDGFNVGDPVWVGFDSAGRKVYGSQPEPMARQLYYDGYRAQGVTQPSEPYCFAVGSGLYYCGNYSVLLDGTASISCGRGMYAVGGFCASYSYPLNTGTQNVTGQSLQQAVAALPDSELAKPLNPQVVADLSNHLWQQAAAQPGYQGLPYQQANPVTAAEAQTWMQQNPSMWPTVRDFVQPRPASDPTAYSLPLNPTAPSSQLQPTTQPNPNAVNPASEQPQVNLGADPAIPQPELEATPTAQQIMAPVLNLLPTLRNFMMPAGVGTCPVASFSVWNHSFQIDAHCTVIGQNQQIIQAFMFVAWSVLALLVLLRA